MQFNELKFSEKTMFCIHNFCAGIYVQKNLRNIYKVNKKSYKYQNSKCAYNLHAQYIACKTMSNYADIFMFL